MAAQNFEYKISNILDKPTESLFGYISVLVRVTCTIVGTLINIYTMGSRARSLPTGILHCRMIRPDVAH